MSLLRAASFALLVALTACPLPHDSEPGPGDPGADAGSGGSQPDAGGAPAVDHLSQAELQRVVTALAGDAMQGRDEGTEGWAAARVFLMDEMTRCGLTPAGVTGAYMQPVTTGIGVNLLAKVPGTDAALQARHVIVSAHYDHVGTEQGIIYNGAYDNASSVAIALGVACNAVRNPLPRTLVLALWDSEEPPTFLTDEMGSEFYAANPVFPLAQTDAVAVMDLMGSALWPGFQGLFVMGSELSPFAANAVKAAQAAAPLVAYRGGLHLSEETPNGHQPWSDYDAFRNRGVPVVFFSDGQNRRYHTPEDDVSALDLAKFALEARYVDAVTRNLASGSGTATFDAAGADYANDAAVGKALLEAALASGGMADALNLSSTSRTRMQGDLTAVTSVATRLAGGGSASASDLAAIRRAAQRVMCHAGGIAELYCNMM